MEETELGAEPAATTAATEDVIRYLKGVSLVIFEENNPCEALNKVCVFVCLVQNLTDFLKPDFLFFQIHL